MDTLLVGELMVAVAGGLLLVLGPGVMLVTIIGGLFSMVRGDA